MIVHSTAQMRRSSYSSEEFDEIKNPYFPDLFDGFSTHVHQQICISSLPVKYANSLGRLPPFTSEESKKFEMQSS